MPRIGPCSQAVVADPDAFTALNTLFAEHFPVQPPARSTPLVALPRGLLFSIEAVAIVNRPATGDG